MACTELPPEKGSALRTLLRFVSRKLSEVGTVAQNDQPPLLIFRDVPFGPDMKIEVAPLGGHPNGSS